MSRQGGFGGFDSGFGWAETISLQVRRHTRGPPRNERVPRLVSGSSPDSLQRLTRLHSRPTSERVDSPALRSAGSAGRIHRRLAGNAGTDRSLMGVRAQVRAWRPRGSSRSTAAKTSSWGQWAGSWRRGYKCRSSHIRYVPRCGAFRTLLAMKAHPSHRAQCLFHWARRSGWTLTINIYPGGREEQPVLCPAAKRSNGPLSARVSKTSAGRWAGPARWKGVPSWIPQTHQMPPSQSTRTSFDATPSAVPTRYVR
jgi:hypothetical protein